MSTMENAMNLTAYLVGDKAAWKALAAVAKDLKLEFSSRGRHAVLTGPQEQVAAACRGQRVVRRANDSHWCAACGWL